MPDRFGDWEDPRLMAMMKSMAALRVGTKAPDFRLLDADGEEFHLYRHLGAGPVVLTFFKISCPTCQYGLPYLDRLAKGFEGTTIEAIAVCQDTPRDAERFKVDFDYTTRVVFDTEESGFPVSNAYGLTNVPTVFLIQAAGGISHSVVSWSKSDVEEIAGTLGVSLPFGPNESVLPFRPG